MANVPNPEGPQVKKGDVVKITSGEWAGMVGEVVEMVKDGNNLIKKVKVYKDGGYTLVEVQHLAVDFVAFADKIIKSNIFKRFAAWVKKLFRKKKKKEE